MTLVKLSLLGLFIVCSARNLWAYKNDSEYLKARQSGASARIVLRLLDDDGECVSNAVVNVLMGMSFRKDAYRVDGRTDSSGEFVIEGKTTGNEIEIKASRNGYYRAFKRLCFIDMGHEYAVTDGKWQPWNMSIELPMRKIKSPASLVRFKESLGVAVTNQWIGFDMEERDWLGEGHRGKVADFEVFVTWDGRPVATSQYTQMDIRFAGIGSGYYLFDKVPCSSFSGVYMANTNQNFATEFVCRTFRENGAFHSDGLPSGKAMVTRSRCKVDEEGRVVSANYSTITALSVEGGNNGRAEVFLNYRFNPSSGDTNLESK